MQSAYKAKLDYISTLQPELDAQREEVDEARTRSAHLKSQLEHMGQQAQEQETAMQELARQLSEEKVKAQEAREATRTVRLVPPDESRGSEEETPRRRKRNSGGSASDSGFESDLDSVFSAVEAGGVETPLTAPSISSWQGNGQDGVVGRAGNQKRLGAENAAWATVEALRSENCDLRGQVEEMQRSLQGCIDFVGGVGGV